VKQRQDFWHIGNEEGNRDIEKGLENSLWMGCEG